MNSDLEEISLICWTESLPRIDKDCKGSEFVT